MSEFVFRYGRSMHLMDITPDLAREWLATLPEAPRWPNGRADEYKVRRYTEMMLNGTWKLMELPIVFRRGRLLSSRHRLNAVIRANITVAMYVNDDTCP